MLQKLCFGSFVLALFLTLLLCGAPPDSNANKLLRVGLAGSQPFVVQEEPGYEGISVEIWQAIAASAGWRYRFVPYNSVPLALSGLSRGEVDLVVGPISITAERTATARFSQPYFQSSLSILSRSEPPSLWQRIAPFFSASFFIAVCVLLFVLAVVGTLIWLVERRPSNDQFPTSAAPGIANGIWFAVVTMTTVGYGDRTPKTFCGRLITGAWMILSVITATSLIAGIASTLTLTGLQSSLISTAEQLSGKRVAVVANSPGAYFAKGYRARTIAVSSIQEGCNLVSQGRADAFVFDRPQLLYFVHEQREFKLSVSKSEYMRQGYGFAFPSESQLVHTANVNLLRLEENGRVNRLVREWLGDEAQQ